MSADTVVAEAPPIAAPECHKVMDGYYRWTDIVWHWAREFETYERTAITSIVHTRALAQPTHPLALPGEAAVKLFICSLSDGVKYLCFTLKQVQYLVHFIKKMRLTDPAFIEYQHAWTEDADDGLPPPPPAKELKPISLPNSFLPSNVFVKVEPILMDSGAKKLHAQLNRLNKNIKKGLPPPPEPSLSPAPGTSRSTSPAPSGVSTVESAPTNHTEPSVPERVPAAGEAEEKEEPKVVDEPTAKRSYPAASVTTIPTDDPDVDIVVAPPGIDKEALEAFAAEAAESLAAQAAAEAAAETEPPNPANYYNLVQQALLLAGTGGLMNAYRVMRKKEDELDGGEQGATTPGESESEPEESDAEADATTMEVEGGTIDASVGRTLFVAMDVRTTTGDPAKVVDFGYSALWFAAHPETGEFEERKEIGYWIAQEEYSASSSTPSAPYAFGPTLPFPRDQLAAKVKRKLFELWRAAGGGAIYIVVHSPDSNLSQLATFLPDLATWGYDLHPPASPFPTHASPASKGRRFVVNTAQLWAAVETGQPDDSSGGTGVTTRSLKDVLETLTGQVEKVDGTDCAGNRAVVLMTVFWRLVGEASLESLRTLYMLEYAKKQIEAAGIANQEDEEEAAPLEPEDADKDVDEYDSDFEGVCYVPDDDHEDSDDEDE